MLISPRGKLPKIRGQFNIDLDNNNILFSQEIRAIQLENGFNERADEEMDVSETDETESLSPRKRQRMGTYPATISESTDKTNELKEENDSLRCQLEAYKNEVDIVKAELQTNIESKEKQIEMLQNTLKGR